MFGNAPYNPAGKTGTAQEKVRTPEGKSVDVQNLTLVGYAPFDDPEVAFAVVVPYTGIVSGQYNINLHIGRRILDEYFELKEKRLNNIDTEETDEIVDDEAEDEQEETEENE